MAPNELKNKIAVVTGAASGIGAAISKTFAARGARLGLLDIDEVAVKAAANDLDQHDNVKVSTIAVPIQNTEELFNPDVVKVVMSRRNYALYFSRAPIPWDREQFNHDKKDIKLKNLYFRHVGIYAYRAGFLNNYMEAEPSPYTSIEALEQLQILWHGGRIHVLPSKEKIPHSVDTQQDLEKMRVLFEKK